MTLPRKLLALLLLVGMAMAYLREERAVPSPSPPDSFSLKGKFVGPSAAEDAATLSALCAELAEVIEYDGKQDEPRLRTGIDLDDLRITARNFRTRGVSIGERQPRVREAIHSFLDSAVGTNGGPVTPEQRAKWVTAFRDISRVCANAAK